jgi:hypothetical protein
MTAKADNDFLGHATKERGDNPRFDRSKLHFGQPTSVSEPHKEDGL